MHPESLSAILQRMAAYSQKGDLSLGQIIRQIGDKGYGLLLIVLSLPSALPVPAAGYSTPFGLLLTIIGLQMLFGRKTLWLPAWAMRKNINRALALKMFHAGHKIFSRFEHIIRPRLSWIAGPWGIPLMGLLVILMSLLMILPIPLTNTAPAAVIFLIGIGLTEDDGLFAAGACLAGLLALLLYALILIFAVDLGATLLNH